MQWSKRSKTSTNQKGMTCMETDFGTIYSQAVSMAEKIGIEPSKPRIAGRQQLRYNAPASTPYEYHKRNLAIPFLDHINENLHTRLQVWQKRQHP
ncbi:hypothetical protein HOLleu_28807 [Holothuria leucospilota]|uniref:Uncharacterized protein n=1 Tax=Holothuria leucospilota TaxID=206669 RepID=A0A9Q1BMT0_HOLLE|nr:hypothetical protein HOLleu_28807 [Holothuria leucospilota]